MIGMFVCASEAERLIHRKYSESLAISSGLSIYVNHFIGRGGDSIFHTPSYFYIHSKSDRDMYFELVNENTGEVIASIPFIYDENRGEYTSLRTATFGGVNVIGEISLPIIEEFFNVVLRLLGDEKIIIKLPPNYIDQVLTALQFNILMRNNFYPITPDLNYALEISDIDFDRQINYGAQKSIKKCIKNGLIAGQLGASNYESAYYVIRENRGRKNIPLTISLDDFKRMIETFPKKIICFGVFDGAVMIAAAICIEIRPKYLYVFYWGELSGYESLSPVTLLANEIYAYCKRGLYKFFDVGTSTVQGVPNLGLIKFKKSLGFQESVKLTFINYE